MAFIYSPAESQPASNYSNGRFTTVHELDGQPGFLRKRVDRLLVTSLYSEFMTTATPEEWYTKEQFFGVLGDDLALLHDPKYGLTRFLPAVELEWASDQRGIERGFIVMEKVHGIPLSEVNCMDDRLAAQVDGLLAGLLAIGIDHSGPPTLGRRGMVPDIIWRGSFRNIIVGTTESDPIVRPRLVDVHPSLVAEVPGNFGKWWDGALARLIDVSAGYFFQHTSRALEQLFGPAPRW